MSAEIAMRLANIIPPRVQEEAETFDYIRPPAPVMVTRDVTPEERAVFGELNAPRVKSCPTTYPEPHLAGEFPMDCYRCHCEELGDESNYEEEEEDMSFDEDD